MRTTKPAAAFTALTAAALAAAVLTPAHAGTAGTTGTTAPARAGAAPPGKLGACGPGELCLWEKAGFKGERHVFELAGVDIESCVALPEGGSAQALANRTGRPVTTYQSRECAETAEFNTYPGGGTWAPESPYRIRAFKVWER
ncbi:peptidase inhibitor family I36 protein [Streptomyces sp. AN091965]|uniref:peptidase inhibitor family I36 protein n=1 Tax=Streptomyces sp. AN091965 TaxID=2927803 RepID=UPI001F61C325|nr:peptidase inhibitor family I36 protein [Streptomyces sp. AN091965]MCI3930432.1 peptidase inhibitor family I36 protein [Streptomyces sp. AN091965]